MQASPSPQSIYPYHRIVLIEGLYTSLSIPPWNAASSLLDERWFIDVGIPEASARLVKRHVASGVAKDLEEAIWRAEENDMPSKSHLLSSEYVFIFLKMVDSSLIICFRPQDGSRASRILFSVLRNKDWRQVES